MHSIFRCLRLSQGAGKNSELAMLYADVDVMRLHALSCQSATTSVQAAPGAVASPANVRCRTFAKRLPWAAIPFAVCEPGGTTAPSSASNAAPQAVPCSDHAPSRRAQRSRDINPGGAGPGCILVAPLLEKDSAVPTRS